MAETILAVVCVLVGVFADQGIQGLRNTRRQRALRAEGEAARRTQLDQLLSRADDQTVRIDRLGECVDRLEDTVHRLENTVSGNSALLRGILAGRIAAGDLGYETGDQLLAEHFDDDEGVT